MKLYFLVSTLLTVGIMATMISPSPTPTKFPISLVEEESLPDLNIEKRSMSPPQTCQWGLKVCRMNRPTKSTGECKDLMYEALGCDVEKFGQDDFEEDSPGSSDPSMANEGDGKPIPFAIPIPFWPYAVPLPPSLEKRKAKGNMMCKSVCKKCSRWTGKVHSQCYKLFEEAGICPKTPAWLTGPKRADYWPTLDPERTTVPIWSEPEHGSTSTTLEKRTTTTQPASAATPTGST